MSSDASGDVSYSGASSPPPTSLSDDSAPSSPPPTSDDEDTSLGPPPEEDGSYSLGPPPSESEYSMGPPPQSEESYGPPPEEEDHESTGRPTQRGGETRGTRKQEDPFGDFDYDARKQNPVGTTDGHDDPLEAPTKSAGRKGKKGKKTDAKDVLPADPPASPSSAKQTKKRGGFGRFRQKYTGRAAAAVEEPASEPARGTGEEEAPVEGKDDEDDGEEPDEVDMTFTSPDKFGMKFAKKITATVTSTTEGGQAELLGVKAGMVLIRVQGKPYARKKIVDELIKRAKERPFEVTFRTAAAEAAAKNAVNPFGGFGFGAKKNPRARTRKKKAANDPFASPGGEVPPEAEPPQGEGEDNASDNDNDDANDHGNGSDDKDVRGRSAGEANATAAPRRASALPEGNSTAAPARAPPKKRSKPSRAPPAGRPEAAPPAATEAAVPPPAVTEAAVPPPAVTNLPAPPPESAVPQAVVAATPPAAQVGGADGSGSDTSTTSRSRRKSKRRGKKKSKRKSKRKSKKKHKSKRKGKGKDAHAHGHGSPASQPQTFGTLPPPPPRGTTAQHVPIGPFTLTHVCGMIVGPFLPEQAGTTFACPHCQQPFQALAPAAPVMYSASPAGTVVAPPPRRPPVSVPPPVHNVPPPARPQPAGPYHVLPVHMSSSVYAARYTS